MTKLTLVSAAVFGMTAVVLGAFGAHALTGKLSEKSLSTWATGNQYQMYHALLLLFIGLAMAHFGDNVWLRRSSYLAIAGILLFSGSLYALALGAPRWLGPVTPLGGMCFIVSWLCLIWTLWDIG